jgi:hypothetical protein
VAARELVQVSRRLPLEQVALRVALLFLTVDTLGGSRRWTLGPLGALELDTEFAPVPAVAGDDTRCFTTRGRLSAPDGYTVETEIVLTTRDGTGPRLTLRAHSPSPKYRSELAIAGRAGLTELAQELRFFGSRQHAAS